MRLKRGLCLLLIASLLISVVGTVLSSQELLASTWFVVGDRVEVSGVAAPNGLLVRATPGSAGEVIGGKWDGDRGSVVDGPVDAWHSVHGWLTWYKVKWDVAWYNSDHGVWYDTGWSVEGGFKEPPVIITFLGPDVGTTWATLELYHNYYEFGSGHVQFSYRPTGTTTWSYTGWQSRSGIGIYDKTVTGLNSGTEYEYRAWLAYWVGEWVYKPGIVFTFTTEQESQPVDPVSVATYSAQNVGQTQATLRGAITSFNNNQSAQLRFRYRQVGASTWSETSWVTRTNTTTYSEIVHNLNPGTNYEFQAEGRGNVNTTLVRGSVQYFTTDTAGEGNAPVVRASDIGGQPQLMYPNTDYTATAKYFDPDGREDLKHCYLQLRHPAKPLTMMWYQSDGHWTPWDGEEGKNYLEIVNVDAAPITEGGLEGYMLTWTFTINDQWPEVENAIDFGVYAWDDSDLKSGWDYDDTKASFGLTPIIKPIAYTVEESALFYVKLRLQNDDPDNSYDVSFRVLDANGDITQTRYYTYIWPGFAKTSENSLTIQGGRQANVTLVFDPQVTADLQVLSEMGIELGYMVQSEHVQELVAVGFEGYTAVTATGFDMTRDAYSFANWEFTPGKCYGMATTSVHYFTGELSLPTHRESTFSLTLDEAEPHIDNYQNSTLNKLLATWTKLFGDNTLTASEYEELITILGNEKEPMLVILDGAKDKKADAHAMIIYGVVETPNSAYMLIYDNNYPFSWLDVGPLPYMQYSFASKELEYETYTKFKITRAHEKWHEWIKVKVFSPAELRVYDSEGRMTGVIAGEVQQEMPWSLFDHEDNSLTILRQPDTYSYRVVGTDDGNYGLSIGFSGTDRTITFTAHDIPTSLGATHQYVIDWDVLADGEQGVTVHVDSDGDGVFENSFTSGSELTSDEFLRNISQGLCFIATAAYGTPMADEIQILRDFRDQYLLTNPLGQALVDFYYRTSPPIAEFITEHPGLKPIVRAGLRPAVVMSTVIVHSAPAEKTVIVGLLVLVYGAVAMWTMRRRRRDPEYC